MFAWQVSELGSPAEVILPVERTEPEPGPGQVRLRVLAAGIGLPDVMMCRGGYAIAPPLPFVPGQEVCGLVDSVGAEVSGVTVGQRMMAVTDFAHGHGGFADFALAAASDCFAVPESMGDVDAAAFRIGYSTAWIGLVRRGQLRPGETLLVLGAAGGSGATAVQVGHALGARVIAVAAGAEKLGFCRRMGADHVIDRSLDSVPDAVRELTDGRGADVIFDPVGGDAGEESLRAINIGGRYLAIGFASGRWANVDTHAAVRRNFSLVGVYVGGYGRDENESDLAALIDLHRSGRLPTLVEAIDFDEIPEALERIGSRRILGKAVAVRG